MCRTFNAFATLFAALTMMLFALPSHAVKSGRQYVVYFGEDNMPVNGFIDIIRAAANIHEAACPQQRVNLHASTDTVGTDAANILRSKRYAGIVADRLVEFGVKNDLIIVSATGERRPPIPTDDNTIQPYNRVVTITFGEGADPYMCGYLID